MRRGGRHPRSRRHRDALRRRARGYRPMGAARRDRPFDPRQRGRGALPAEETLMFTLKINTANAAFDDAEAEVARILAKIAHNLRTGIVRDKIRDINGNHVGEYRLTSR